MSLVQCPECKNSISNKAESCPHCGYKNKKGGISFAGGCMILLLSIIVIGLIVVWQFSSSILNNSDPYDYTGPTYERTTPSQKPITLPQENHTITGTIPKVSRINLNKGIAILTLTVISNEYQYIKLDVIDPNNDGHLLISEVGESGYIGSKTYRVETTGIHIIEISAKGNWTLKIE